MTQIVFDDNIAAQLEELYMTADVLRRRALVRDALAARAGEDVLDIGCGPGFYAAEVHDQIGETGSVLGIDASEAMLAIATHRCEGHDNVRFEKGLAQVFRNLGDARERALQMQIAGMNKPERWLRHRRLLAYDRVEPSRTSGRAATAKYGPVV